MITLGIDTTAVAASAALVQDGKLLSEYFTNIGLQHSRTLMPMIHSMLACCNISMDQIERFGITAGPGSFTGVRIGVAAVKGMAITHNIACVPLSTLEILANNIPDTSPESIICPVMDARCNQVYNALFQWKDGDLIRLCEDRAIEIQQLKQELKLLDRPVIWVGDGAELCYRSLENTDMHHLAPEHIRFQRASQVALLAEQSRQTISADHLAVSYLRPPQAVRAKNCK